MKKVLVFNAPYPHSRTLVWDVSEKYSRERAYVDLFHLLDRELDVYHEGDTVIYSLIDLARSGNSEAAEALLCYRRNRKNESFEEIEVRCPSQSVFGSDVEKSRKTSKVIIADFDDIPTSMDNLIRSPSVEQTKKADQG